MSLSRIMRELLAMRLGISTRLAAASIFFTACASHIVLAKNDEVAGADASAVSNVLRVCADPDYLPFSNRNGEGFQNKVAEVVAKAMGRKLSYVWESERGQGGFTNFLADTLDAGRCDVVMDFPHGDEEDGYTKPYYQSAYVFVTRKSDNRAVTAMTSPALAEMKIGFQDDTTPVEAIKMLGLIDNAVVFNVAESPRESPRAMLQAVQDGQVDVMITWQPAIGYFLKDYPDLRVREVPPEQYGPGLPQVNYAYKMSMGVRKNDNNLKEALDKVIDTHRAELDAALNDSGVKFYTGRHSVNEPF